MKLQYKGIKDENLGPMKINPAALKRQYGTGYREFKATLSPENYERICQLVPTGAGRFGSALINLAIELLWLILRGEELGPVVEKITGALGNDDEAIAKVAKTAMTLALGLKVAGDKAAGRLVIEEEKEDDVAAQAAS